MFKQTRYFRWAILLVTIAVEALAFWLGGRTADSSLSLAEGVLMKLRDPVSWIWVGWASLSMAWLWAELAFVFFSNGRRTRAVLRRSNHEKLVFDTGVHWLVLLRDIHLNQLNDGEKERLEEGLFPQGVRRSFAWHAIWWPILLAIATMIYFLGWAAWSLRQFPDIVERWGASSQQWIDERFNGSAVFLGDALELLVRFLLQWLEALNGAARDFPLITIGVTVGVWIIARLLVRATQSNIPIFSIIFTLIGRVAFIAGIFVLFSTQWFDWLSPIYSLFPNHGLVAVGFIPLTFASAFYFPHILFWSSWRYAILRDRETFDATLITLGGVFNSLQQRINLQRIVDTDIFQLWWQRIFDVGDIELKQMGGGEPERVRHVYGPNILLDEIRKAIREGKKRSGQASEFGGRDEDNQEFG